MENQKILIIDDEEDFRMVLADRLTHEGFVVLEAADGLVGVEMALQEQPDLILLDIMMPGLSGHQVWSRIQKHSELSQIPLLILSAKMQASDVFWGDRMSSNDYLIKAASFDVILKRIHSKLKEKKSSPPTPEAPLGS